MNRTTTFTVIAAVAFSLAGCGTSPPRPPQLKLTYNSDPQGAMLYEDGKQLGYTPYTSYYTLSDEQRNRGKVILRATKVVWASGATAEAKYLSASLNRDGLSQQFTFLRPTGVPGREADARFSLELRRVEAMESQAASQASQAQSQSTLEMLQMYNTISQQFRVPDSRRPTNCTSTVFGSSIDTSCY